MGKTEKLIFIVLSVLLVFFVVKGIKNFYNKKTYIHQMEEALMPVKETLQSHSPVSYQSNTGSVETYYVTQFVLAPSVIENKTGNDLILIIDDLNIENKTNIDSSAHFVLLHYFYNQYKIVLLKKL